MISLVSFAAIIRVVTQRFSVSGGEALRDDPNNGCEGDYDFLDFKLGKQVGCKASGFKQLKVLLMMFLRESGMLCVQPGFLKKTVNYIPFRD